MVADDTYLSIWNVFCWSVSACVSDQGCAGLHVSMHLHADGNAAPSITTIHTHTVCTQTCTNAAHSGHLYYLYVFYNTRVVANTRLLWLWPLLDRFSFLVEHEIKLAAWKLSIFCKNVVRMLRAKRLLKFQLHAAEMLAKRSLYFHLFIHYIVVYSNWVINMKSPTWLWAKQCKHHSSSQHILMSKLRANLLVCARHKQNGKINHWTHEVCRQCSE